VIIHGSGFGADQGSSQILFNGAPASALTWNDTSIHAIVPEAAATGPVTVVRSGMTSNGVGFILLNALSITSLSPTEGRVGSSVTIHGTGFGSAQNGSTLDFNTYTPTVTSWSDTQIVVTVPPGATSGPVSAKVAGITYAGPEFTVRATNQITDSLNNVSNYTSSITAGKWAVVDSDGSGCSSCTVCGIIHQDYDSLGNSTSTTDALGHETTYTYDSNNNVTSVVAHLEGGATATTSYPYNSFGEVLTTTDPLGNVTTNTYDDHGNLLSVTTPASDANTSASATNFTYDSSGQLLTITDPLSHVTTMTYYPTGGPCHHRPPESHHHLCLRLARKPH